MPGSEGGSGGTDVDERLMALEVKASFIDTGMFPNTTPPLFTPWLKPEALAEKIVAAVRTDRLYVREPSMVKLIPLVKALPRVVADALCSLTGMDRSLQGPSSKKT